MRLIDADAVVAMTATCPKEMDIDSFIEGMGVVLDRIYEAPTVDAVPVVRCGECRWYDKSTASGTYKPIAYKCKLHQRFTIDIQFCSDGEREDDEQID